MFNLFFFLILFCLRSQSHEFDDFSIVASQVDNNVDNKVNHNVENIVDNNKNNENISHNYVDAIVTDGASMACDIDEMVCMFLTNSHAKKTPLFVFRCALVRTSSVH